MLCEQVVSGMYSEAQEKGEDPHLPEPQVAPALHVCTYVSPWCGGHQINSEKKSNRERFMPRLQTHLTVKKNPGGVSVWLYLVSDRSCSLIRWIHSSSSGAWYAARYSSRSRLKKVGDSPEVGLLPSGNRGNRGLIHILMCQKNKQKKRSSHKPGNLV